MTLVEILWSVVMTLLGAAALLFCWWQDAQIRSLRDVASAANKRADEALANVFRAETNLAAFKTDVAQNYTSKADTRDIAEKFERTAERIFDRIDDLANRLPPRPQ